jgi:SAM-dependent methyltransferase
VQTSGVPTTTAYTRADLYDLLYSAYSRDQAKEIARIAKRFAGPTKPNEYWLEPACGTARILIAIANLKTAPVRHLVGIDLQPEMIAFAKRRLRELKLDKRITTHLADMRTFAPRALRDKVRVAFCPDNSIRHLPSDAALVDHLRGIRSLLAPGGVYLVGIGLTPEDGDFPTEDLVQYKRGKTHIRHVFDFLPPDPNAKGPKSRKEKAYVHLSMASPAATFEEASRYDLRTYSPRQWPSVIKRAGMREVGVVDHQAKDLPPSRTRYAVRVLAPI